MVVRSRDALVITFAQAEVHYEGCGRERGDGEKYFLAKNFGLIAPTLIAGFGGVVG